MFGCRSRTRTRTTTRTKNKLARASTSRQSFFMAGVNIEHRTSNIEHRMQRQPRCRTSMFGVRCSTFDVSLSFALALVSLLSFTVHAEVTLPKIIGDHMVLQHGTAAPVWGKATPGETIRVQG